jgi:hypothetical protein
MAAGALEEPTKVKMGEPLILLIICGDLHDLELEVLKEFMVEGSSYELEKHNASEKQEFQDEATLLSQKSILHFQWRKSIATSSPTY